MVIFLEIVLGIVIAVGFYNLIHHFLVTMPNHKRQLVIEGWTDQVVHKVIKNIAESKPASRHNLILYSHPLSRVWGREVLAYEYKFNIDLDSNVYSRKESLSRFKSEFAVNLAKYCRRYHDQVNGKNIFVVADAWCYQNHPYLDVACRLNSSTKDYLDDIHKV